MSDGTSKAALAQHVVSQMSYSELHESAIAGLVNLYESDEEKFQYDLENEGLD